MGDPSPNNEVLAHREARTDREQHRSSAQSDLREPRRQDETRRTVDLGHSSDGPSWIDLAEIRINTTESRFAASLNRLLHDRYCNIEPPVSPYAIMRRVYPTAERKVGPARTIIGELDTQTR